MRERQWSRGACGGARSARGLQANRSGFARDARISAGRARGQASARAHRKCQASKEDDLEALTLRGLHDRSSDLRGLVGALCESKARGALRTEGGEGRADGRQMRSATLRRAVLRVP